MIVPLALCLDKNGVGGIDSGVEAWFDTINVWGYSWMREGGVYDR